MNFSKYQLDVFNFGENQRGHGTVEAVAGAGKTFTGIELVQRFNKIDQGLFASFTKSIVDTLSAKLQEKKITNVRSRTYNSFGAGLIYKYMKPAPKLLTESSYEKSEIVFKHNVLKPADRETDLYYKSKGPLCRLVALFKSLAIINPQEAYDRFDDIVEYYDIELPKDNKFFKELTLSTFEASMNRTDIIDYDDQKFFPVLFGWDVPQVQFLVIDEYQDTSPLESALMMRACKYGRIIVFGDSYQAIYSFKGTTPDSMAEFTKQYSATRLPLSICYRCPKAVIREAQKIVPHIEWADNAIEGSVNTIGKHEYRKICTDRDMVLCRTTQHLVKSVMDFIGEGRGAYVAGREYGTQLKYFIDKLALPGISMSGFISVLDNHFNEMHPELIKHKKESQALRLETKYETTKILCVGCQSVNDLHRKIDSVFMARGNGIQHMTIHKSKGLEGDINGDVHILRPDLLPHPRAKKDHLLEEENRLRYVGITRTRRSLNWVLKDKDEK